MRSIARLMSLAARTLAMGASVATAVFAQGGPPGGNQFPGGPGRGGGGPPGGEEVKLVKLFDKDGDKRLNAEERTAARAYLVANQQGQQGGPGGPGRPGGPGGPGGRGGFGGRGGNLEPVTRGASLRPADVKPAGNAPIYDIKTLRTFFLEFEDADWEQELAAFYNTDVEVPATVTVDGKVYRDVGVHFRGASSFFSVPEGRKRSLNLSFDFVHADQRLGGYATFNLLNASGDPTFLRTVLYQQIARAYLPSPAANLVRVAINGEHWGVYPSQQQFDRIFTREQFGSTDGARWKVPGSPQARAGLEYLGESPAPYRRLYEIKSKDDPASWTALIDLCRVLNETPADRLERELAPLFDIDGALKFLAVENVLVNEDGYWARASDYSIYRDVKGRFHIVPHDANEGFPAEGGRGRGGPPGGPQGGFPPGDLGGARGAPPGGFPGGPPGGGPGGRGGPGGGGVTLDPLTGADNVARPLLSKLLAVPALRARYVGYVRDIAEHWLDWTTLEPLVTQYQALIAADVRADTHKLSGIPGFESAAVDLKKFADERRAFLLNHAALKRPAGR
jgi:hypothetical protein